MRAVVETPGYAFLPRTRSVAKNRAIGIAVSPSSTIRLNTESRLHGGFIKTGEGASSVTSFKLCHSIFPTVLLSPGRSLAACHSESHKNYVNLGGAGGKSIFHGERRRLVLRVQGDLRSLGDPRAGDCRSSKLISAAFSMIVEADARLGHRWSLLLRTILSQGRAQTEADSVLNHRVGQSGTLCEPFPGNGKENSPKKTCHPGSISELKVVMPPIPSN